MTICILLVFHSSGESVLNKNYKINKSLHFNTHSDRNRLLDLLIRYCSIRGREVHIIMFIIDASGHVFSSLLTPPPLSLFLFLTPLSPPLPLLSLFLPSLSPLSASLSPLSLPLASLPSLSLLSPPLSLPYICLPLYPSLSLFLPLSQYIPLLSISLLQHYNLSAFLYSPPYVFPCPSPLPVTQAVYAGGPKYNTR